ncbi:MAG: sulfotransferase family protein [Planctomycetota bacterium]|jgi:hypothetical protein
MLHPPVLVIGGTRSGTTMLGSLLGRAPGMCFLHEPNTLWRIGHAYRDTDRATATDARPWVKRRIRRAFERFQEQHGGRRIVEKSPYNVVRVPFVREIFPEARLVHIYRDGRAMLRSQVEQYETFPAYDLGEAHVRRHLVERLQQTPWWEWPAYLPRAVNGLVRRHVLHKSVAWFGLRYPGWRRERRTMSQAQLIARQWVVAVESALQDLEALPADAWLNLRYEEVVSAPLEWFERICSFCGIEPDQPYLEMIASTVQTKSRDRWEEELDPVLLEEAMPVMQPLMERLGYA